MTGIGNWTPERDGAGLPSKKDGAQCLRMRKDGSRCERVEYSRGVCFSCYQGIAGRIRAGRESWDNLIALGQALPAVARRRRGDPKFHADGNPIRPYGREKYNRIFSGFGLPNKQTKKKGKKGK